jgi:hypothetical protein
MIRKHLSAITAGTIAIWATLGTAGAWDDLNYPNLKGQWHSMDARRFDPAKPFGQGAPLTAEYQAIHDANTADQAAGGHGTDPTYTCLPPGMPRLMMAYEPVEIVVADGTTHILTEHIHDSRRIYTDGRDWPVEMDPSFNGYSIGHWRDVDGDGRYDLLEVETRGLKGPRSFDASGIPLHANGRTVVRERIALHPVNPNLLTDEITVIDDALTRPWTVSRTYRRDPDPRPVWRENVCAENNPHLRVGQDDYFLSSDGHLMPVRKGQAPPDLRYFR